MFRNISGGLTFSRDFLGKCIGILNEFVTRVTDVLGYKRGAHKFNCTNYNN